MVDRYLKILELARVPALCYLQASKITFIEKSETIDTFPGSPAVLFLEVCLKLLVKGGLADEKHFGTFQEQSVLTQISVRALPSFKVPVSALLINTLL